MAAGRQLSIEKVAFQGRTVKLQRGRTSGIHINPNIREQDFTITNKALLTIGFP